MFQPGAMLYTQSFGVRPENVEVPTIQVRNPTSSDVNYPIGKTWINTTANDSFLLTSFSSSGGVLTANWQSIVNFNQPATTTSLGVVQLSTLAQLESGSAPSGPVVPLANDVFTFVNSVAIEGGTDATTAAKGIVYLADATAVITPYTPLHGTNTVIPVGQITTMFASPPPIGGTTPGTGVFTTLGFTTMTGTAGGSLASGGTAINIGTDNSADAINIGTAAARTITLGSTSATALNLRTGTAFSLDGGTATTYAIGASTTTGTIVIGGSAQSTGAITVGSSSATNTLNLGIGTGVNTTNISTGSGTANNVNIATGNGGNTVSILTGTTANTFTLGGVGGDTINIGNAVNTSSQTINIAAGASGAASVVNILTGVGTAGASQLNMADNRRVNQIDIGNVAPAAARVTTISGGNSAQNDTVSILNGAPSANTQTFNVLSGTATGGTQVLNLGNGIGGSLTINMGNGVNSSSQTINIANAASATAASIVNILSGATPGAAQTLNVMNGVLSAAVAQTLNVMTGNTGSGSQAVNVGTGSQAITIKLGGTGAGVKTVSIADGISGNQVTIGNGANTTAQSISLASGAAGSNSTVNILNGVNTTGTQTLNILTGTSSGGTQVANIATGSSPASVNIGNSAAGAIALSSGSTISATVAAGQAFNVIGGTSSTIAVGTSITTGSITIGGSLTSGSVNIGNASATSSAINLKVGSGGLQVTGGPLNIATAGQMLQIKGASFAATNFIGVGTLASGTVTINNTNIATGDVILITRTGINGSTTLGVLTYSISNATSFTVTSVILGTPGSTQTGDTSTFSYVIVRPS